MSLPDLFGPTPGPLEDLGTPVSVGAPVSVGEAVLLPDLSAFRDRLAGLVAALVHDEDDDDTEPQSVTGHAVLPSGELRAVTKRISAQYVDVLARAAARLLSGDSARCSTPLCSGTSKDARIGNRSGGFGERRR